MVITDLFFELNNGIITVDVGSSPTGGTPEYVSTIGYSGTAINTTVTGGDTIYLFNASTNIGQFVFNSSWVTSSNQLSPKPDSVYRTERRAI